ncbi:MAG: hypothetical protein M1820_002384 [Bogoriella megaspora]|nr:MAG: hypothetical protein M1820_002384 [Bogoriella megaspora]
MCGLKGSLPYWDWVLDWEDFRFAPIWNDVLGFGGNGSGAESLGNGSCVSTGPFARLEVLQFGDLEQSHCLSRGFVEGQALWDNSSSKLMPAVVDNVLDASDYEDFNQRLELGPHLAIPHGVRGDFTKFTAPYDPVFYLHHCQLDRLWWLWQQRDIQARLNDYGGGVRGGSSKNNGDLKDVLELHGLGPDVQVSEVMDTQSGTPLCYRY